MVEEATKNMLKFNTVLFYNYVKYVDDKQKVEIIEGMFEKLAQSGKVDEYEELYGMLEQTRNNGIFPNLENGLLEKLKKNWPKE